MGFVGLLFRIQEPLLGKFKGHLQMRDQLGLEVPDSERGVNQAENMLE